MIRCPFVLEERHEAEEELKEDSNYAPSPDMLHDRHEIILPASKILHCLGEQRYPLQLQSGVPHCAACECRIDAEIEIGVLLGSDYRVDWQEKPTDPQWGPGEVEAPGEATEEVFRPLNRTLSYTVGLLEGESVIGDQIPASTRATVLKHVTSAMVWQQTTRSKHDVEKL